MIGYQANYAEDYYNFGYGLFNLGQYQVAVEYYDQVLKIQIFYPKSYSDKANALCQLKYYSEGLEVYKTAIKQKPDYADAHYIRLKKCLFTE